MLRALLGFVLFVVVYVLVFLATGAIAVNRGYVEPQDGVEIWVHAGQAHTDLIVPVRHAIHDWSDDLPVSDFPTLGACYTTHVVFGWGERGFYIDVGDWENLTVTAAVRAMFYLGASVMHVDYMSGGSPATLDDQRRVVLTQEQYRVLVDFIRASFARDAQGRTQPIPGFSYWGHDAFYEGSGRYGLFYTCNTWTNAALRRAGAPTSLCAVFPQCVMSHLPAPPR